MKKQSIEILQKQEELLWFDAFDGNTAWELGTFMKGEAEAKGISIAVCIRLNNGCRLFQYVPVGTNVSNQSWMERKYETVKRMERSTLLSRYVLESKEQTLADHGTSERECTLYGGGFPIRVRGAGMIGVLTVSALPHEEDHEFIVRCLEKYLKAENVPHLF